MSSNYLGWADWLDALANSVGGNRSPIDVLRESADCLGKIQRIEARRIADGIEQGRSWPSLIDDPDNRIPIGLREPLAKSISNNLLGETATILAEALRSQQQFAWQCFMAAMYTMIVAVVAWIGVMILVDNLVPALNTTIELMHEKPTAWLVVANTLYDSRWIWGIVIPILVIGGLGSWISGNIESSVFAAPKNSRRPQTERRIMALKLGERILSKHHPIESIKIADHVFLDDQSSLELPSFEQFADLSREAAMIYLKNMVHWQSHQLQQVRRWWVRKLPVRLTLILGTTMILAYLTLGVFPWLWVIQRSLRAVS